MQQRKITNSVLGHFEYFRSCCSKANSKIKVIYWKQDRCANSFSATTRRKRTECKIPNTVSHYSESIILTCGGYTVMLNHSEWKGNLLCKEKTEENMSTYSFHCIRWFYITHFVFWWNVCCWKWETISVE